MSSANTIGMWIGDSFAEIASNASNAPVGKVESQTAVTRWFLPKKSIADALRESLLALGAAAKKGGTLSIASSRTDSALAKKQGNEPALLVTSGFEAWARLSSKNSMHVPSLRADRAWFPTSVEQTFGIDERITNDGVVERPLKMEELEFLVAKLQLTKTKEVAIGFLHADKYPDHERQAAQFLREKGFKVVASHEIPGSNALPESARWRKTLEAAYAETLVQEDIESLRAVFKEQELDESWNILFWGDKSQTTLPTAASIRGGVETAAGQCLPLSSELGYFFGLEEFLLLRKTEKDGATSIRASLLPVQPTCQIGASAWPFPSWTSVDRGYEPGPMLFGKSHQLTILDVLYVRGHLKTDIEAFSERVQEKAQPRILEALTTLGKDLTEPGRRSDAKLIAEDLETSAIERLALELNSVDAKAKPVYVFGPFAPLFLPLLQKRRPDVKFVYDAHSTLAGARV